MSNNITLSYKDLTNILNGNLYDEYPVSFDNIPTDGNPQDYIEDDGRQYRQCIFTDNKTGIVFGFNYTWNPNWEDDLKYSFSNVFSDNLIIIGETVTVKETPIEVIEPQKEKTPYEIYSDLSEVKDINDLLDTLPMSVFDKAKKIYNDKNQSIGEFKRKLLDICIEYKIEQSSLLSYIRQR
jgi:hypothetical protein